MWEEQWEAVEVARAGIPKSSGLDNQPLSSSVALGSYSVLYAHLYTGVDGHAHHLSSCGN